MEIPALVLAIAALALAVSAAIIGMVGGATTQRQAVVTTLHTLAPILAALGAGIAAWGYLRSDVNGPEAWLVFRAIVFAVGGALLLAGLALTAAPTGRRPWDVAGPMIFAFVASILAFAIAEDSRGARVALWWVAGALPLAIALSLLWLPLREMSDTGHPLRREAFVRRASLWTVLFALLPLFTALSPRALGLFGSDTTAIAFAVLSVAIFAGYCLFVALENKRLSAVEPAERAWPPARTQLRAAMAAEREDRTAPPPRAGKPTAGKEVRDPLPPASENARVADETGDRPSRWHSARDRLIAAHRQGEALSRTARTRVVASRDRLMASPRVQRAASRSRLFVVKVGERPLFATRGRPVRTVRPVPQTAATASAPKEQPARRALTKDARKKASPLALTPADAVPVLIVAGTLLTIATAQKAKR